MNKTIRERSVGQRVLNNLALKNREIHSMERLVNASKQYEAAPKLFVPGVDIIDHEGKEWTVCPNGNGGWTLQPFDHISKLDDDSVGHIEAETEDLQIKLDRMLARRREMLELIGESGS